MDFRGSKVIILDSSSDIIRGIHGLDELLRPPAYETRARVGRRRSPLNDGMDVDPALTDATTGKKLKSSSWVAGKDLDAAEAVGEDLEIFWPFRGPDAWSDWRAIEALWKHVLCSIGPYHRKTNDSPILLTHPASLNHQQIQRITQLLFERLNVPAISLLSRPLASLYAVSATTGISVEINALSTEITPVVDSTAQVHAIHTVNLGIDYCEKYLAHLLSTDKTVTAALEGPLPTPDAPTTGATSEASSAPTPPATTPLPETLLRLSRHLWRGGFVRPVLLGGQQLTIEQEEEGVTDIAAALAAGKERALIEARAAKSHKSAARQAEDAKKRAAAAAADGAAAEADIALVEFEGREIYVGRARHRFCEPLFNPSVLKGIPGIEAEQVHETMTVAEGVERAIGSVIGPERLALWEGVVVVGEMARIKTLPASLLSHLMPYLLTDPESTNDSQPKNTRFLKIPKYFPEYIEEGGMSIPFLGASIVGKLVFGDQSGRFFTTKIDYNHHGPTAFTSAERD